MGFFAVDTFADCVYASFSFCIAGIAFVLPGEVVLAANLASREVLASVLGVTKLLTVLALSGRRGGV